MPLGDPHLGICTLQGAPAPDTSLRTCCNTGYARGTCPQFADHDAPDAVRFGILRREAGVATVRYVRERNHHPFDDGTLELREAGPAGDSAGDSLLELQARAYLSSYLRRAT